LLTDQKEEKRALAPGGAD
jgi:hypothetical protein